MSIRSADATIKGYYYQFNKTIESLFDLNSSDETILIEGIEDIDVNNFNGVDHIQCKYYSSSTLTNSAIREAIVLMLDHYIANSSSLSSFKYNLFGYFKNETLNRTVTYDIIQLKNILTYKENKIEKKYYVDKSISDLTLNDFLKIFRLTVGKEFYEYRNEIIKKIRLHFKCSDFNAENHYYNNALRVVMDRAIKPAIIDRTISRRDFLLGIDCSRILFFEWFRKYKSTTHYHSLIRKQIKTLNLFSPGKDKMIVLGKHIEFQDPLLPIEIFIENLIEKFYRIPKISYMTKPMTVVLDSTEVNISKVKSSLISKGIKINDGWETIQFSADLFSEDPIINKKPNGCITKASFIVRIISNETFKANYSNISKKFSILYISEDLITIPDILVNQLIEVKYLNKLQDIISIF